MNAILDRWQAELTVSDRPDEFEVKSLLTRLGLRVPRGIRLAPGTTRIEPDFPGPYVAKVCSADIMHKTDLKGVYLQLEPDTLAPALTALTRAFPEASILLEEMVTSEGPEMIAGGLVDPGFGSAVMVGAGGILTEISQDVTFRLAPLDEAEARRMLMELKVYPAFEGFRGLRLDPSSLAELMVTIGHLIDALGLRFDQLDLNPIVWNHTAGWTILDAKLILRTSL